MVQISTKYATVSLQIVFQLQRRERPSSVNIGYTFGRLVLHRHKTLGCLSIEKNGFRLNLINSICGRFGKGDVLGVNLDHEPCGSISGEIRGTYLESFPNLYGLFLFRSSIHDTIYDSTTLIIFISGIVIVIFAFVPNN